ncbi:uncharacterized protein LOC124898460 [Capsicum annuum]|uniref:uncharacterized protein LOC124898460 n=1 Tax=Capsicum annuum TaxID=4072 RepID=UPI001FB19131|nr:uncharacterized protein LOC124898460 [Capsicum annuum]
MDEPVDDGLFNEHYEFQEKYEIKESEDDEKGYGRVQKKRIFDLESEGESYFGTNFCGSNAFTSVPPSVSTTNLEEFMKQLIPSLNNHFLPVVFDRIGVQEVVTSDPPTTNDDDVVDS